MTIDAILYAVRNLADAVIEHCERCKGHGTIACENCSLFKTKAIIKDVNRDITRGKL